MSHEAGLIVSCVLVSATTLTIGLLIFVLATEPDEATKPAECIPTVRQLSTVGTFML